jgi:hypothetical protein
MIVLAPPFLRCDIHLTPLTGSARLFVFMGPPMRGWLKGV